MDKTDVITCIVQKGNAENVVKTVLEAGAQGATVLQGRGTGVRQKLGVLDLSLTPEKEVILVVTKEAQTEAVFNAMVAMGELEKPGRGFAYVQKAERVIGFID
jgi:nitrogen regulatory protein PII